MTRSIYLVMSIVLSATVTGCATTSTGKFSNAGDVTRHSAEEERLWEQARSFDSALAARDSVYLDEPATSAYVQEVMDRLYPEFKSTIRVQLIRSPQLNAFALPNGSIYFNVGLAARLDNEAQLATVLAHEGAHFVNKHSLQSQRNLKNSAAFANTLAMLGIPFIGDFAALSSVYGYSQDLEREADEVAFERLQQAGYDTREAAKTFIYLLEEVETLGIEEPFFFSSHPALRERIESFNLLSLAQPSDGGIVAAERYREMTLKLRIAVLEYDLAMNRCESVILVLERDDVQARYPAYAAYYLGEAYRRCGDNHPIEKAMHAYQKAIRQNPDFAPSYHALGVQLYKQKKYRQSRQYLQRYLDLQPDGEHAGYTRHYLQVIDKETR